MHRNIDDAFPLFVRASNVDAAATVDGLVGQQVNLEVGYAQKVDSLLYALSELNDSVMLSFRAVYATYQSDPCAHSDFLARKVDEMTAELQRLTGLRLQLRAFVELARTHPDRTDQIWSIYSSLVEALKPSGRAAEIAASKIIVARGNAERWIRSTSERS